MSLPIGKIANLRKKRFYTSEARVIDMSNLIGFAEGRGTRGRKREHSSGTCGYVK